MNKFISIAFFSFFISCSSPDYKVEGTFENPKDGSHTIIKKIDEKNYEVMAEFNPSLHFDVVRDKNILSGSFKGLQVKIEFNNTYDSITNKNSNGDVMFTARRVK